MHICVIYEWTTLESTRELAQVLKDAGHTVFFGGQIDDELAQEAADVVVSIHKGEGMLSSPDQAVREQMRKACRESYDTIKEERRLKQEERERKAAEQKAKREAWRAEHEKRIQEAKQQEIRMNGLRLFE